MIDIKDVEGVLAKSAFIEVESPFTHLLNEYFLYWEEGNTWSSEEQIEFWFSTLGVVARVMALTIAGGPSQKSCVELLIKKNTGYGNRPLLMLGTRGIACRCVSKVCRIENILEQEFSEGRDNESLEDNLKDLFNYAILAILMIEGRLA